MDSCKIIISSRAQSDLAECVGFVLNVSREAAWKLAEEIYSFIESLSFFPERYPVFKMPKATPITLRKGVVSKRYAILYSIENENVVIYRILDLRKGFDQLVY